MIIRDSARTITAIDRSLHGCIAGNGYRIVSNAIAVPIDQIASDDTTLY